MLNADYDKFIYQLQKVFFKEHFFNIGFKLNRIRFILLTISLYKVFAKHNNIQLQNTRYICLVMYFNIFHTQLKIYFILPNIFF
jgi:hypothetical protein